jgi:DNA-binding GntR family transcriptional regulator
MRPTPARNHDAEIVLPGVKPLAEELYDYLRDAIVCSEIPSGTRVVEDVIATRAKVSRTPVGRALRRLHETGLLRETRNGLVVNELSADELAETCTVRDTLEALAARLAAATRTDLDVAMMEEVLRRCAATDAGNVQELVQLNYTFHSLVWDAARNSYLKKMLSATRPLIERLDSTTIEAEASQRDVLTEHRALLEAIVARDANAAEKQTLEHFRRLSAQRVLAKRTQRGDRRAH